MFISGLFKVSAIYVDLLFLIFNLEQDEGRVSPRTFSLLTLLSDLHYDIPTDSDYR